MEVSESPPIYWFLLLYCLNFIAQFDKLLPRTLKNSTPEEQTERKNDRFETHPKASEISRSGQNFQRPTSVFRGTILYPYFGDRRGAASL